jgi:hypothetical protein
MCILTRCPIPSRCLRRIRSSHLPGKSLLRFTPEFGIIPSTVPELFRNGIFQFPGKFDELVRDRFRGSLFKQASGSNRKVTTFMIVSRILWHDTPRP